MRNGDIVTIDVKKRRLDVALSAAEIKRRVKAAKRRRYAIARAPSRSTRASCRPPPTAPVTS